jgi:hypothetical protein
VVSLHQAIVLVPRSPQKGAKSPIKKIRKSISMNNTKTIDTARNPDPDAEGPALTKIKNAGQGPRTRRIREGANVNENANVIASALVTEEAVTTEAGITATVAKDIQRTQKNRNQSPKQNQNCQNKSLCRYK